MSLTRHASAPIPGDLSADEIDRIMRQALLIIRRQGSAALARVTFVRESKYADRQEIGGASRQVLDALADQPRTVYELGAHLRWTFDHVHGVLSWLRKQHKIRVHHWTTSEKGRRVAVYQVNT